MIFIFIFTGNLRITIYSKKTVNGGRTDLKVILTSYLTVFSFLC